MGSLITLDRDGNLKVIEGWKNWRTPAAGARVETVDHTGKRVTPTRVVTMGVLALLAKKKTGHVTVIITGADGDQRLLKVPAKKAEKVLDWAAEFNAWQTTQQP